MKIKAVYKPLLLNQSIQQIRDTSDIDGCALLEFGWMVDEERVRGFDVPTEVPQTTR